MCRFRVGWEFSSVNVVNGDSSLQLYWLCIKIEYQNLLSDKGILLLGTIIFAGALLKKYMSTIRVDCVGETCPVPLVETRKVIRKASPGDIIEVNNYWNITETVKACHESVDRPRYGEWTDKRYLIERQYCDSSCWFATRPSICLSHQGGYYREDRTFVGCKRSGCRVSELTCTNTWHVELSFPIA